MVWKQGTFLIWSSIVFENVKRQREEKQKIVIWGQFYIFKFFKLLEIWKRSWYELKCYATFLLKNATKSWSVLLHCRYTRDIASDATKAAWIFITQKWGDHNLWQPKKSYCISCRKAWYYLEKNFNSKINKILTTLKDLFQ